MDSLSTAFLGVIAFAGVVQAAVLLAVWLAMRRLGRRTAAAASRVAGGASRTMAGLSDWTRRLASLSEAAQERRVRWAAREGRTAAPGRGTPASAPPHALGRPFERWEERQDAELLH